MMIGLTGHEVSNIQGGHPMMALLDEVSGVLCLHKFYYIDPAHYTAAPREPSKNISNDDWFEQTRILSYIGYKHFNLNALDAFGHLES